jgi:hypothetical protein
MLFLKAILVGYNVETGGLCCHLFRVQIACRKGAATRYFGFTWFAAVSPGLQHLFAVCLPFVRCLLFCPLFCPLFCLYNARKSALSR